jgi:hypothetical protein
MARCSGAALSSDALSFARRSARWMAIGCEAYLLPSSCTPNACMNTLSPVPAESDAKNGLMRDYWPRFILISAAIIVPCFWHRYVEAGDLASHVYNAWLAQLIQHAQAHGLYVASQWNNVLFDFTLIGLAKFLGLHAAERIATFAAVLIFFWGSFAFISSMARRAVWNLIPIIAICAYGWTFEEGLMNYYISLGLAFFGLTLLRSKLSWHRGLAVILAGLIWLANPLGLIFLIGAGTYILLADVLPPRSQLLLFAASAVLVAAAHFYGASLPQNISADSHYGVIWKVEPGLLMDGHDQLLLYGPKYLLPAYLLQFLILASLIIDVDARKRLPCFWNSYFLPAQLFALVLLAAALLPTDIRLPQYAAPLEFLTERLTSVSAILACCLIATLKPRKWHFAVSAVIAGLFFFFLYRDTAAISGMEDRVAEIVRTIPPGQRVIANISWQGQGSRVERQHIVDRACIEWCFSYANYEPSTAQFRIRARPGNPIVIADAASIAPVAAGKYVVQQRDLPLYEIYSCDSSTELLCVHELTAGEINGSIRPVHP